MSPSRALAALLLLCSAGSAAALVAGTQCRAVPSLVARPSVRCCAAEEAVVEEVPPSCDFPGCDGRGRALGGLGAIPLFSWWPIKVRPSPCISRTPAPALARLRMPALVRTGVLLPLLCCFRLLLQAQQAAAADAAAAIAADGTARAQAYRPCPTCAAKGMKYSRSGQTLDEIVFKKRCSLYQRELQLGGTGLQLRPCFVKCLSTALAPAHGAFGGSGQLGTPMGRPTRSRASRLQSRRSHSPPLTTQEPGGRILRRGERPLRGLAGPGRWRPWRPTA